MPTALLIAVALAVPSLVVDAAVDFREAAQHAGLELADVCPEEEPCIELQVDGRLQVRRGDQVLRVTRVTPPATLDDADAVALLGRSLLREADLHLPELPTPEIRATPVPSRPAPRAVAAGPAPSQVQPPTAVPVRSMHVSVDIAADVARLELSPARAAVPRWSAAGGAGLVVAGAAPSAQARAGLSRHLDRRLAQRVDLVVTPGAGLELAGRSLELQRLAVQAPLAWQGPHGLSVAAGPAVSIWRATHQGRVVARSTSPTVVAALGWAPRGAWPGIEASLAHDVLSVPVFLNDEPVGQLPATGASLELVWRGATDPRGAFAAWKG